MKSKLKILIANIVNSFQNETAYFANNLCNLLSTSIYVVVMLLFINVLFANTQAIAGYSKNEIMFLLLLEQLSFYGFWFWTEGNRELLRMDVKMGTLDFLLIKPISSLFYVSFRKLNIVGILRDALPNVILIIILIDWNKIEIIFSRFVIGLIIFICGQIAWNGFCFLLVYVVFWQGESEKISDMVWPLGETSHMPYEGLPKTFKFIFTSLIPSFICATMSTSVILGKSNKYAMLFIALSSAVFFSFLKIFFWNISLKQYTSAA